MLKKPLWVMVSHPYRSTSDDPQVWAQNLRRMNGFALAVWELGHIPIVGATAALPLIKAAGEEYYEEIMMPLALSLLERCDALLWVGGHSKGVDMEVSRARERGIPVFESLEDLVDYAHR